jgi:hypothetical protein
VGKLSEFVSDAPNVALRIQEIHFFALSAGQDSLGFKNRSKELNGSAETVAVLMNWTPSSASLVAKK